MKRTGIGFFAVYCLLAFSMTLFAADAGQKTSNKSAGAAISGETGEVKKETVKTVDATKDAIVRDARAIKEEIPKGLKEAKESAIRQSKEFKKGAAGELKEIGNNMAHPKLTPKSDQK